MKGLCKRCNQYRELTKHSLVGKHKPPFIRLCRACHNKIHGMTMNKRGIKHHKTNLK